MCLGVIHGILQGLLDILLTFCALSSYKIQCRKTTTEIIKGVFSFTVINFQGKQIKVGIEV